MGKYLSSTDRATILKDLTKEQKKTLFTVVGKRQRSYFANVLAKYKGTRDWCFYRYIDHGEVRKDITCGCGRPLRHQYILVNKKTKEKRTMGSTHLMEELNIPESIAKEVLHGFHHINCDLDELLQKYVNGWELPPSIKKNLSQITVPNDIYQLLSMDLPLLSRQIKFLYSKAPKMKIKKKASIETFIFQLEDSRLVYEIKNEEIYKVLMGEIDSFSYINQFQVNINEFLTKEKHYKPIYDLISYLIKAGLPYELMYGQHALTKHITNYLETREDIKGIRKDNVPYYKI